MDAEVYGDQHDKGADEAAEEIQETTTKRLVAVAADKGGNGRGAERQTE